MFYTIPFLLLVCSNFLSVVFTFYFLRISTTKQYIYPSCIHDEACVCLCAEGDIVTCTYLSKWLG